jgi:hypothetical protein
VGTFLFHTHKVRLSSHRCGAYKQVALLLSALGLDKHVEGTWGHNMERKESQQRGFVRTVMDKVLGIVDDVVQMVFEGAQAMRAISSS